LFVILTQSAPESTVYNLRSS